MINTVNNTLRDNHWFMVNDKLSSWCLKLALTTPSGSENQTQTYHNFLLLGY